MKPHPHRFIERPTTQTVVVSPRITLNREQDAALIELLRSAPAGQLAQVLRQLLRLGMAQHEEGNAR